MKIAQIAPVEEVVPPRKYGGTELVVSNVTEELIKRGHDVTLFASGDSKTSAKLIPLVPKAIRVMTNNTGQEKIREAWKYIAQAKVIEEINKTDFDIVHQHVGWRLSPIEYLIKSPVITTCHNSLTYDVNRIVFSIYKNNNYVTISDSQQKQLLGLNYISTVYNGINPSLFSYNQKPDNYYAFLGRMSPDKGPRQAILAAQKARVILKMAAKIDLVDEKYFDCEIKPLIDGKQIQYIGEIGPKEKNKFLANAKALIAPIQWEEPFGLYFVEAMACGTPVISINRGSAPEIIKHGYCGYLASKNNDVDEISDFINKFEKMGKDIYAQIRDNSRQHVEKNFTVGKMVDGYEKVYKQVIEDWKKKS